MLRKEEILERTNNGLSVFKHYIPGNWRIGRNFLNPLYEDNKASCNIYFDRRNGCYKMKDFGNDSYSGDCFFFVGQLKGLDCNNPVDFVEILETIDRDLGLGLAAGNPIPVTRNSCRMEKPISEETPEKESKPYQFREQKFPLAELMYWQQYSITPEILELYKVCSLRDFQSETADGTPFTYISSVTEPMYGYKNKRYIKLYRPFSKTRFLYGGNLGENYCFGLEQLPAKGDTLFITGGEKDVMSLAAHGFHAICFNSETVTIPPTLIYKLTFRFKHIILLYDSDKTGKESARKQEKQLEELGIRRLLLPLPGTKEEKDISDYFKAGNTREDFLKLFIEFLDNLYSDTLIMLKSCEIDFNNPPAKAQVIISAGDVPLGTQGNLFGITGGEGTGKSNYIAAMLAGCICQPDKEIDTLGIQIAANSKHKAVLLYDTEQSEVQLFKNVSNLLTRAKQPNKPEELKAFCLTGMSRKERLHAIVQSMDKFYYQYGGIQLVVIDGIADLVKSANDEVESVAGAQKLDGYITGAYIYNKMGLTEQVATTITVATLNPVRRFRFKNLDVECVKSYTAAYHDETNIPYLRLLDAVKDIKHIPGSTQKDIYERIKNQHFNSFSIQELIKVVSLAKKYPPRVRKVVSDMFGDIGQHSLQQELVRTILPTTRFNLNYMIALNI